MRIDGVATPGKLHRDTSALRIVGAQRLTIALCVGAIPLEAVERVTAHLNPAGALWIVHPKGKASSVPEALVRAAARACGPYDAKVVAFSATHSATKWMIPLAARARR